MNFFGKAETIFFCDNLHRTVKSPPNSVHIKWISGVGNLKLFINLLIFLKKNTLFPDKLFFLLFNSLALCFYLLFLSPYKIFMGIPRLNLLPRVSSDQWCMYKILQLSPSFSNELKFTYICISISHLQIYPCQWQTFKFKITDNYFVCEAANTVSVHL